MSEYKLFVQRIGLVGISQVLVTLSSIILLPILTKNYSVSDYGIWVQITVTLNLIPGIITLGLPFSMMRFLPSMKNKRDIQEGFYSIISLIAVIGILTSIILFVSSDIIAHYLLNNNIAAARILSVVIFFTSLNVIYLNYFKTFQKMKIYSIFMLLQAYLPVLLVSYFALSGYNISFTVVGLLITQIIIFIIALALVTKQIGFNFPNFQNIREYISLGLPTISSSLSYWIVESSDRYIIGLLLGTAFVGFYSPSYTLGNLINMVAFPFSVLLLPLLSRLYDEDKMDKVRIYLKYSLKFFVGLAIPSAIGLSLLSWTIINLLSTSQIADNGYFVTPFVTLGAIFSGIYSITINIIILKKKTKLIGMIWTIAAILNAILNFALIPYFGIIGAAGATLAAYSLAFVITMHYSFKYFKFDFDLPFIAKSIFASALMSLIIIYFYPTGVINLLTVIIACSIVYIGILILLKGFNEEEVSFIKGLLRGSL